MVCKTSFKLDCIKLILHTAARWYEYYVIFINHLFMCTDVLKTGLLEDKKLCKFTPMTKSIEYKHDLIYFVH